MDVARQKEAVLKACVQAWIDKAFLITADIKGKLTHMKAVHTVRQVFSPGSDHSSERVEQIE